MKTFYIKLLPFVSLAEKASLHKYESATDKIIKFLNKIIASTVVIIDRLDIFHIKLYIIMKMRTLMSYCMHLMAEMLYKTFSQIFASVCSLDKSMLNAESQSLQILGSRSCNISLKIA